MWQWIAGKSPQQAHRLTNRVLDILFPPVCHACRGFITTTDPIHICPECSQKNPPLTSPLCLACGAPFKTENGIDHRCGHCLTKPPPFDAARAAVSFAGPVRELIHLFKYERKMHLRRPLGLLTARILAGFATSSTPDLLIPVPLHSKRLRQRSFNQALLLAELLGKSWQIPVCRRGMVRSRWTEPQINLSAAQRAANVRDAFIVAMPEEISGRRVMLVDDVYTTGCTVAECARVLRAAGATAVFVVTTARATPWG